MHEERRQLLDRAFYNINKLKTSLPLGPDCASGLSPNGSGRGEVKGIGGPIGAKMHVEQFAMHP